MVRFVFSAVAALVLAAGAQAAIKIGTKAPNFSGLETADGKSVSLADFKDKDVLVVCVTCNHCPMAVAYEDRLVDFVKKHAGKGSKVGFLAVSVSNMEADLPAKMKERAQSKGFNFIYAHDASQKIGKDLEAKKTPEFFVFDKDRKLVYTGAMDDSPKSAADVKHHYLEDAVKAVLKGEKPSPEKTDPVGCGISYKKSS